MELKNLDTKSVPADSTTRLFEIISWQRMILSAMVVAIHVHFFDETQTISKTAYDFYHLFTNISVPAFFAISGMLFFRGNEFSWKIYLQKLKNRSRTLVVPYYFFTFFSFAIFGGLAWIGVPEATKYLPETWSDWCGFTQGGPALWFVHDLILMAIFSPIIFWAIKKLGVAALAIAAGFFIFPIPHLFVHAGTAIFWFSLGAFIGINKIDIVPALKSLDKWALLAAWILLAGLMISGILGGNAIWQAHIFVGVVASFVWANYFVERWRVPAWVNFLAGASMMIYCVHDCVPKLAFDAIFKWLYSHILPHNSLSAGTLILGEFIFMYASSLLIFVILKKLFPRFCSIISGGR